MKGAKLCKSRGAAVDVPYYLSKYDPDPLRFYLTATVPETRDTKPALPVLSRAEGSAPEGFSWEDIAERHNPVPNASEGNELVATRGNLANAQGYSDSY